MNKLFIKLRLLNQDGTVSLTAITLLVVLIKVAISPDITATEVAALFTCLLAYQAKRLIRQKDAQVSPDPIQSQINEVKAKMAATFTLAEDAKKLMSQANVALGFRRTSRGE